MKQIALIAAAGSLAAFAAPASAAEFASPGAAPWQSAAPANILMSPIHYGDPRWGDDRWDDDDDWRDRRDRRHWRGRGRGRDRDWDERRFDRGDNRYWRGRDGRWRCRRPDGTTGLLVGAGVGALLGREVERGRARCR